MKTPRRKAKMVKEPAGGRPFIDSVGRWWKPVMARRQILVARKQDHGRLSVADQEELDLLDYIGDAVMKAVGGHPGALQYLDGLREASKKHLPNASARSDGRLARLDGVSVNANPFHPVEANFLWSSWNFGWAETDFDPFAPKCCGACRV